jgi:hypothetical protein
LSCSQRHLEPISRQRADRDQEFVAADAKPSAAQSNISNRARLGPKYFEETLKKMTLEAASFQSNVKLYYARRQRKMHLPSAWVP